MGEVVEISPLAASTYRRFFGRRVHGQPQAALHVSREALRADLRGQTRHCGRSPKTMSPGTFRIGQARLRGFAGGASHLGAPGRQEGVASLLAMHPDPAAPSGGRTTTFQSIREEARKEAALHYLRETGFH
jgi:hypothetical protein